MPLLVLLGIAIVTTPFVAVYLLMQQAKLRRQVDAASEENERRHAALQRELVELRKQVAARAAAGRDAMVTPAAPAGPEIPVAAVAETKPEIEKKEEPVRVMLPVSKPPTPIVPARPVTPVVPVETKPVAPETTAGSERKSAVAPPPPPPSQPTTIPAWSTISVPAAGVPPPAATPRPSANVPPVAARVSVSSLAAPLRISVPKPGPTMRERMKKVSSIEETLGTNWLNKLGIIILVMGVALFGICTRDCC
jgi:hypothetical protein